MSTHRCRILIVDDHDIDSIVFIMKLGIDLDVAASGGCNDRQTRKHCPLQEHAVQSDMFNACNASIAIH
jgi:hypothetical protein